MIDRLRFDEACRLVSSGGRLMSGIGTRSEKTVHAVLKNYYEPYQDSQELKVGGYVADIVGEDGIIEIQTAQFSHLKEKLRAFLPAAKVRVVYPVFVKKRIVYLDADGEVTIRRTSPLKETPYELFREIFPITEFLTDPRLSFSIFLMECDELRIPPEAIGKKKNRRGRLSVYDRVPTSAVDEITIDCADDWEKLIPCLNDKDFTSADLAQAAGISRETAMMALNALNKGGIVTRTGKNGRAYTYSRVFAKE